MKFIKDGSFFIFAIIYLLCLNACNNKQTKLHNKVEINDSLIVFQDNFESGSWNADFQNGDSTGSSPDAVLWKESQMQGPFSGQVVDSPVRSGKYAMKFEWQRKHFAKTNTSKKAHLNNYTEDTCVVKRWYAFSVYFPEEYMKCDTEPEIFAQWHAWPDFDEGETWHGCGPVSCLKIQNDTIYASWHGTSKRVLCGCKSKEPDCGYKQLERGGKTIGKVPKNRWIDFVVLLDFNPFGGGAMKVWMDNKLVVNEENIAVGYNDSEGPYLCIGIYKYTGRSEHEKRILYYDEIIIGNEKVKLENFID